MKQHLLNFLKFLLFLGLGLGILYGVYVNQQANYEAQCELDNIPVEQCSLLEKLWTDFSQVKPLWIGMVVLCFMLSNISRALRWGMLITPLGKRVKFHNALMALMLGYLVNYVVPRAGEVAKCGALGRYEKVPLDQLLGTIVVARSLDVICFGVIIGLAFLLNFDLLWGYLQENALLHSQSTPMWERAWFWGVVGIALIGAGWLWLQREQVKHSPFYKKLWEIVLGFWKGIKTISQLERPALFWTHTVFIWSMYYMMHYVAFFAFEPTEHLMPADGLTMFVFGSLGIIIPTPGGLGSYQFLVTTALTTFYAIPQAEAFSFSMIVFFPPFVCNLLFGFLSLILLPIVNAKQEKKG